MNSNDLQVMMYITLKNIIVEYDTLMKKREIETDLSLKNEISSEIKELHDLFFNMKNDYEELRGNPSKTKELYDKYKDKLVSKKIAYEKYNEEELKESKKENSHKEESKKENSHKEENKKEDATKEEKKNNVNVSSLEPKKKYKVKEVVKTANQKAGKAINTATRGGIAAVAAILACISLLGGISAIATLITEKVFLSKIIGAGAYGAISYFTGKGALGATKLYNVSKLDVNKMKEELEKNNKSKKK